MSIEQKIERLKQCGVRPIYEMGFLSVLYIPASVCPGLGVLTLIDEVVKETKAVVKREK